MFHCIAKSDVTCSVPGINGIEGFEFGQTSVVAYTNEIEAGIGNRASAICKLDERQHRARRPDLGVIGASALKLRQREDAIANRTGTDEQAPHRSVLRERGDQQQRDGIDDGVHQHA